MRDAKLQTKNRAVNVTVVVLSLLLAFGLWLYVVSTESPTGQRVFESVPVKISGTDTLSGTYGFSVLTGYDSTARITLRGKQSALNALDAEDLAAKVELADITAAGSYEKKIQVTPPAGLEVVSTSPSTLVIDVDVEKTVSVPVLDPEETYTLAEGVQFKRTYSAESISVRGPQTVVDKIHGIKCSVELGDFVENVIKTVPIRFVDEAGNEITDRYLVPSQNTLTITYTLYKEKTVPLVLDVSTILPAERVSQSVSPSQITVQGPPEQIEALTEVVAKKVSTAEMTSEYSRFFGTVALPEGLSSPSGTIQYTAETSLSGALTTRLSLDLSGDNVVVTEPKGLKYRFESETVGVNVRTQYDYFSRVDATSLLASVNLSSFTTPGTYPVEVTLSVREADQKICYVTDTVTVNVILSK